MKTWPPCGRSASPAAFWRLPTGWVATPAASEPAGGRPKPFKNHSRKRRVDGEPVDLRAAILNGIEAANQSVRDLGTGAATTMALVEIQNRTIRPYHVGDSAILVTGQRGKVKLQTIPHSPIGYAVEAGMMKDEDAIHHESRHVISNVIGSDKMRIEIGPPIEMAPRDTLLIASDGLFDNLLPDEIVEAVRSGPLEEAIGGLIETAQQRMAAKEGDAPCKPDDLTVIAYRPN